jgi:hypothetical protein
MPGVFGDAFPDGAEDATKSGDRLAVKLAKKLAGIQIDRAASYGKFPDTCDTTTDFLDLLRGNPPDVENRQIDLALTMLSLKLARLAYELRNLGHIKEDTCLDLANYALLLYEVKEGDENGQ